MRPGRAAALSPPQATNKGAARARASHGLRCTGVRYPVAWKDPRRAVSRVPTPTTASPCGSGTARSPTRNCATRPPPWPRGWRARERVAVWAPPRRRPASPWSARCSPGWPPCRSTRSRASASSRTSSPTARPALVLAAPGDELPAALARCRASTSTSPRARASARSRRARRRGARAGRLHLGHHRPAQGRRAAAPARSPRTSTRWPTPGSGPADDVLVHALPLFHVHGLILGILGAAAPRRRGAAPGPVRAGGGGRGARARRDDAVRRADDVPPARRGRRAGRRARRRRSGGARLLVSGSAALPGRRPRADRARDRAAGRRALRHDRDADEHGGPRRRRPPPRHGRRRRCPASSCGSSTTTATPIDDGDDETIGEIQVRGPNLFLGYLNRPDATAEALRDGWFRTGDLATRDADGYVRIVGRRATDLIKSGGYKIGAGEIEDALLEHPGVARGRGHRRARRRPRRADRRLGRPRRRRPARPSRSSPTTSPRLLAPHKRPREVRFLDALPRNAMGKIMKHASARDRRSPPGARSALDRGGPGLRGAVRTGRRRPAGSACAWAAHAEPCCAGPRGWCGALRVRWTARGPPARTSGRLSLAARQGRAQPQAAARRGRGRARVPVDRHAASSTAGSSARCCARATCCWWTTAAPARPR